MSTHKPVLPWLSALWALAGMVLAVVCIGVMADQQGIRLGQPLPAGFPRVNGEVFIAIIFLLGCLAVIAWPGASMFAWLRQPRQLQLDAQGLTVGGTVLPYADIVSMQHDHDSDILRLGDGRGGRCRLRLALWSEPDIIQQTLSQQVSARLLPAALSRIAAGETVTFGPVGVAQTGIVHERRVVPWGDIRKIQTQMHQEGDETTAFMLLTTPSGAIRINRSEIINEPVLLGCLGQYLRA